MYTVLFFFLFGDADVALLFVLMGAFLCNIMHVKVQSCSCVGVCVNVYLCVYIGVVMCVTHVMILVAWSR